MREVAAAGDGGGGDGELRLVVPALCLQVRPLNGRSCLSTHSQNGLCHGQMYPYRCLDSVHGPGRQRRAGIRQQ
jgi:hypothetical protein